MTTSDGRAAPIAGELVLEFRGRRVETEDEVGEIEDALVEILPDDDALLTHEIGSDARRIVIATRDATATLRHLLAFLERAELVAGLSAHARVAGDDAGVSLWPPHRE